MMRTQITITDEQGEELRRLSSERRRSQAALVRDAIDSMLGHDERKRRVDRARSPVGAYRSGRTDTSEKHDAALDEAFEA